MLQRLQTKVIKIVDVSYGGENGFNQAIELASEALGNVKFIQEKKLIGTFAVMLLFLDEIIVFSFNSVQLFVFAHSWVMCSYFLFSTARMRSFPSLFCIL